MEHLKASPCGDAHESLSPQTEQFISLLERRGIVEDPEITSERVRERSGSCAGTCTTTPSVC